MEGHILSFLIFFPLVIGMPLTLVIPRNRHRFQRSVGTAVLFVNFLVSLRLIPSGSFREFYEWIPTFGIHYHLASDTLSVLLIILTTALAVLSLLGSWKTIMERTREFNIANFLLSGALIGVFTARDFFLFYIFWESILIPMFFIIGVWGGTKRIYASFKFLLYTFFGSIFMFFAILIMVLINYRTTGVWTFDMLLLVNASYSSIWRFVLFLLMFIGFAVKVPLFPFHTWLPYAHVEAPAPGSVMLAGVLLKMGVYGFIRVGAPLMGGVLSSVSFIIMIISIIGILYGAVVSLVQSDLKKLIAYSSVSHMGFVCLGIFSGTAYGVTGGTLQMINHGISTGALFLLVGMLYERTHTRQIKNLGGIFRKMPIFSAAFFLVLLSSIAVPGTNGFVGEFLILLGTFKRSWGLAVLAVPGIILSACYMLWLYQRVFLGELNFKEHHLNDLTEREIIILLPLVILIFWIGLYPAPLLKFIETMPVADIIKAIGGPG